VAFTLDQQIQAAEKEYRRREFAYPRAVEQGHMKPEFADYQLRVQGAIVQTLRNLKKGNALVFPDAGPSRRELAEGV
jgi:hypothetical protein